MKRSKKKNRPASVGGGRKSPRCGAEKRPKKGEHVSRNRRKKGPSSARRGGERGGRNETEKAVYPKKFRQGREEQKSKVVNSYLEKKGGGGGGKKRKATTRKKGRQKKKRRSYVLFTETPSREKSFSKEKGKRKGKTFNPTGGGEFSREGKGSLISSEGLLYSFQKKGKEAAKGATYFQIKMKKKKY